MNSAVFINEKGGVGKSSCAWSMACYEAERGRRVLLVDCDGQRANLTYFAGIAKTPETQTLYDVLYKDVPLSNVIKTVKTNLDIVPATSDVSNVTSTAKISRFKAAVKEVKECYDLILFDVNPGSWMHVLVLSCVDDAVITMLPDVASLEANKGIVETINDIKDTTNPSLRVLGLLFNRNVNRTNLSRQSKAMAEIMAKDLDTVIFDTKIRDCVALGECIAFHQGVTEYSPKSPVSEDIRRLSDEFWSRVGEN